MNDLPAYRRYFAEEIEMVSNVRSAALVDALATVPRERFLPPGPWTIRGEADIGQPPRQTIDADPRRVYHNVAVAIDPSRMLFNGAPGLLCLAIDSLAIAPGSRVLHVGTGTGYFTALIAHCAGARGHVVGIEADVDLAAQARTNLSDMPWVDVRHGDARDATGGPFDAILINAGVTHPLPGWLDALLPNGRILFPLTAEIPGMQHIGKGPMLLATAPDRPSDPWTLRTMTFVAIFSAVGLRDAGLNAAIGQAMQKYPLPPLKALRRDVHERSDACWLHAHGLCFSLTAA